MCGYEGVPAHAAPSRQPACYASDLGEHGTAVSLRGLLTSGLPHTLRHVTKEMGEPHRALAERLALMAERGANDDEIGTKISEFTPKERRVWEEIAPRLTALTQRPPEDQTGSLEARREALEIAMRESELYTRVTRPRIARQSWYTALLYAITLGMVSPLINAFSRFTLPHFSETIFIALAAPAFTYMGVRALDKWRSGGLA